MNNAHGIENNGTGETPHEKSKSRSISFRLTTSIILTVACVSVVSIFFGYLDAASKAKNELEKTVERNTTAISDILQVPLWTYDQETIENIGKIFSKNEDIVNLTIIDSLGQILFHIEKKGEKDTVFKKREVLFNGKVAGTVEMAVSSEKYRKTLHQLLWTGIITMVINLTVLIIFTGVFLRLFLKNPLDLLSRIVNSYSSGNYATPKSDLPYIEFQPVVDVMTSMGSKITSQIGELRQAEKKFRGIFENAVEGIFQISPLGRFISANPSMAGIFGYDSPDDMIETVENVADQCFADRVDFDRILDELSTLGAITGYIVKGLKQNRMEFWLSMSARTVRDLSGEILFFEGSIMDISDRIEREEAERRQKAADAANQAKTLFIARMSHELRTPLNSVLGMTEMLRETALSSDQKEYINLLQTSGEFLESIINDILDFSKIEAQQLVLDHIPFDLYRTVEDATALIRVRAREKDLDVTVSIDPEIPRVMDGDPVRLKQILINLAGNAVKFTHKGLVRIDVTQKETCHDDPGAYEILFRVTDTGIGIPESKIGIIFDSFTQADTMIKRQFGGTGLGLSICKRLVELMGGTLNVTSVEGQGSVFFFSIILKQARNELPVEQTGCHDLESVLSGLNILLADDIEPNRAVVHRYLKNSAVTIIDAENGKEAYEAYMKESFDIVLMDVEMPVMNGLEAIKRIREWEQTNGQKPIPVIVLSAHAFGEQRKQCFEAGCNALLVKPIRKKDLVETIVTMIRPGFNHKQDREVLKKALHHKNGTNEKEGSGNTVGIKEKIEIDIMFEDLLDGFFDYFHESVSNMKQAVHDQDFDNLYRLGHGLKGSARNYGFTQLGDMFYGIEKAAAGKQLDEVVSILKKVSHYLEHVDVEFVDMEKQVTGGF